MEWGVDQADSYLATLFERFQRLADNPEIGKPRPDVQEGFHGFPFRSHMIFYLLGPTSIEVIGVPHQSMDILKHLDN